MFLSLVLLLSLVQVDHQFPESRVEGIVEVPQLFGDYPCDRYEPQTVMVYPEPAPTSAALGTLGVTRPWYLNESSPCEAIQIGFWRDGSAEAEPVVFREYGYEEAGLVVVERRDDWFRIRLSSGSGWIQAPSSERFHPYAQLVTESLAYVNRGWTGLMWAVPGAGVPREIPDAWQRHTVGELTVDVLEGRMVNDELWFRIRLDPEAGCGELPDDLPVTEGWLRGYTPSGHNALWYYSRGC